ncbi:MAG: HAD-IA family hydrolase [Rhodocyclaceae bacterium]|nr:HAD-IA family hydrolase [Rhodocyclaceae bacterium]
MSLEAVLFDVDGTLADTEEAHRQAFNAAFEEFGLPWHWDAPLYRKLLAVTGGRERIAHYCREVEPARLTQPGIEEFIARLHARKTKLYEDMVRAGQIAVRPGVVRLLAELKAAGIRLAIATTTSRANVEVLLATTLAVLPAPIFEVMGCGEEAAAKKPAPDVYLWVLERLSLPAEACLAIEDSRNGVLAARSAGIPVLVTESAWTQGEDFAGAAAVLPDLGEVDLARLRRIHEEATCRSSS